MIGRREIGWKRDELNILESIARNHLAIVDITVPFQTVPIWQGGEGGNYSCNHTFKDHIVEDNK
ncbi:hypothetical protein E2562_028674 [Oryza meyeriana var. granulata]|uniref:Uncharacterized protein n=1 Tax=Oryza meyeriana var. granulata TaxID=110450 RepID=A0A6G1BQB4_9ORYZ|nr:hypothetical protein E2562_028674 [Oryza meyeriana var. granulata]